MSQVIAPIRLHEHIDNQHFTPPIGSSNEEELAFARLYHNYYSSFVRFAESYVRSHDVAEDLVGDSILYYWENRSRLSADTNIPAYILTTLKHRCINHLEQQKTRLDIQQSIYDTQLWDIQSRIDSLEDTDADKLYSQEILALVEQGMGELPEKTRRIFYLSRFKNRSHKEIATHFQLSTKAVEFHISKALKTMRRLLKDYL